MGKSYRNDRHEHSGRGSLPRASQRRASTPKYRRPAPDNYSGNDAANDAQDNYDVAYPYGENEAAE
jgi:hypothetical protein